MTVREERMLPRKQKNFVVTFYVKTKNKKVKNNKFSNN